MDGGGKYKILVGLTASFEHPSVILDGSHGTASYNSGEREKLPALHFDMCNRKGGWRWDGVKWSVCLLSLLSKLNLRRTQKGKY
jgi:hypothetical protein